MKTLGTPTLERREAGELSLPKLLRIDIIVNVYRIALSLTAKFLNVFSLPLGSVIWSGDRNVLVELYEAERKHHS